MATPEGGVRYAPEDPSIPKPWKGLIDDKTGFLYYWNPESNVTQYDKPVPLPNASSAVSYQPVSSSVQNSQGRHIDNDDPSIPKPWKGLIDPKTGFLYYWNPESNATQYEKPAAVSNPSAALSNTSSALSNKPWNPQGNATPHEKPVAVSNSSSALSYPPLSSPVEKFSQERRSDLDDPSLPKPWKGLIDPKTGFLYYWNPESNATQYEKLAALTNPSSDLSYKPWNPESNASQYEKPTALSDTSSALSYQPLNSSVQKFSQGCPINNDGPSIPKPWKGSTDDKTGFLNHRNPESNATPYDKPAALSNASSAVSYQPWNPVSNSTQYGKPSAFSNANSAPPYRPLSSSVPNFSQGRHVDNDDDYKFVNAGNNGYTMAARSKSGFSPMDSNVRMIGAESSVSAESYRRRHEISVTGDNVPQPFSSFESTGFPLELLREAQLAGFSAPTPIQAQSWPIAIQGRDIVAIAKTGSGKTLGYLIPAFLHLKQKRNNPKLGPTVLVLSPTRELATQIQAEAFKFGRSSNISCTCLYGGAPKGPQLAELERGVDVVVATPGRLNDILEMRRISLHQVSYMVLDEADRMLDMGFEPQIRKIMNGVPSRRQTLLYTATWPKEVRKIAADLLINPVQVNIGNVDELVANKSITQYVEVLSPMDKLRRLEQILRSQEPGSKVIIFCSTKRMCDQLASHLSRQFGAAAIHGDKSQGDRDYILNQFRNGRSPVLVATDVAARGLDIKDIRVVVNFDFPNGVEDYVHRIGRTGRAGATGVSFTFLGDQDAKHASDLVKLLEGANQVVPNEVRAMVSRAVGMGIGKRQWGSGPGGRGGRDGGFGGGRDGGFGGGRDGGFGRGGFGGGRGMPSSFDRGVSHGFDRPQQSRDRYGSSIGPGANTNGRFHHNSFTETTAPRKRARSRSRSPRRSSRSRSQSRSRSRSRIRSRSRSRSRSRIRSRSLIRSRSRSYSPSPERFNGAGPTRPVGPGPGH